VAGIRRQSVAVGDSIFALGSRFGDEEATVTGGGCAAWRRETHGDLGFVPWHPDAASRRGNAGGGGALLGSRRRRCARARETAER
jgi:S1-C subfamily serine protease